MNIATSFPPIQRGKTICNNHVKAFATSMQGASHVQADPPMPCQDYNDIRYLETENLLIAAIADGVGSCKLSHWGAYIAVKTVLDSVEVRLKKLANKKPLILDAQNETLRNHLKAIMVEGFENASNAVENCADSADPSQPVFSLQSTLTLAIYDGKTLLHGHVGDDGIVVQNEDGQVTLATKRLKGDDASSVYPLQSGKSYWTFGLSVDVTAFVMATDGVLDAFVSNHNDYFDINYNNGIFYGFMEDAVYKLAENTPDAAKKALKQYYDYLMSAGYRAKVKDDLTMVCVVSSNGIQTGKHPEFNMQIWRTIEEESNKARRNRLASKTAQSAASSTLGIKRPVYSNSTKPPTSTGTKQQAYLNSNKVQSSTSSTTKQSKQPNKIQTERSQVTVSKKNSLTIKLMLVTYVCCLLIGFCVGRYLFPKKVSAKVSVVMEPLTEAEPSGVKFPPLIPPTTQQSTIEQVETSAQLPEVVLMEHNLKDTNSEETQVIGSQNIQEETETRSTYALQHAGQGTSEPSQTEADSSMQEGIELPMPITYQTPKNLIEGIYLNE